VDVRLLFWRPDPETAHHRRNAFWGAPEHLAQLEGLRADLHVRWDRAHPGFCQHQKTWLIDAGHASQAAFVGGINLNPHELASPGHRGEGQFHDVNVELSGPVVADVHHNFVQRWNEASERHEPDGVWGGDTGDLAFPTALPPACGTAAVQIQRTTHPGRYRDGRAPVGGEAFEVAAGERTVLEQVLLAIVSARSTLYLENQYLDDLEVVRALEGALERGVEVVLVMPVVPERSPGAVPPTRTRFAETFAALGRFPNFTLSGLAGLTADGTRTPVYVHAKLMLVDDVWASIGSANLHRYSLHGNGELNAAIDAPAFVRAARVSLFEEHLGIDTGDVDDVAALREFRRVATRNRERFEAGDAGWQGIAFRLEPSAYGEPLPFV
jgi:phosphatidylserine/phosphatidylglycerophosphate/cardiolipin synthase-like enzyme